VPLELLPDHAARYHLIGFDASGHERVEPDGPYSATVLREAATSRPTDVFVFSHGWQGDVPAAREQYGRWVTAMLSCQDERDRLAERPGGFRPLLVGLHWPSKAWGDEELGSSSFGVEAAGFDAPTVESPLPEEPDEDFADDGTDDVSALVAQYAGRLGDSPSIRRSVHTIVSHALEDAAPVNLPEPVRRAYEAIDTEIALGDAGAGAAPGADREPFDAEATYQACQLADLVSFGGPSLGGLLAPLRTLTFWQMKRRARDFGESGAARLLDNLRRAAPDARLHLMGHSFGCIVASAAVAGSPDRGHPRAPVASLVLVQGAMSLWSFCSSIPSRPERPGYFHRLVAEKLVTGPVLVTTSPYDRAVRTFYPIGAGVRGQVDFEPGKLPTYGGIGVFGIRGPDVDVAEDVLTPQARPYDLRPGRVLNLDAAEVIRNGTGPSGAHSDICHRPLAQAIWQAVAVHKE
jgi:pimeloyl-ACP methyl ester carboxylesterase